MPLQSARSCVHRAERRDVRQRCDSGSRRNGFLPGAHKQVNGNPAGFRIQRSGDASDAESVLAAKLFGYLLCSHRGIIFSQPWTGGHYGRTGSGLKGSQHSAFAPGCAGLVTRTPLAIALRGSPGHLVARGSQGKHLEADGLLEPCHPLSLQLPFAIVPLLQFTNDPRRMGGFANAGLIRAAGWVTTIIASRPGTSAWLEHPTADWANSSGSYAPLVWTLSIAVCAAMLGLLIWMIAQPYRRVGDERVTLGVEEQQGPRPCTGPALSPNPRSARSLEARSPDAESRRQPRRS